MTRLVRIRELEKIVGLKRLTIDRMERRGEFPKRVRLPGARAVAWYEDEIQTFIEQWRTKR